MGISKYNIKKWSKMIFGKSILHVNQGVGTCYNISKIEGYYNDLTEKVTKDNTTQIGELPKYPGNDGVIKIFPIGVFQYGLGAYDLFLKTNEEKYFKIFKTCFDWTMNNQDENGGWKTFEYESPDKPYSAMAQGEAISLLSRGYIQFKNKKILDKMDKGIQFLMKPVNEGGVAIYKENDIYLKEFVDKPVVLNGWIFSIFGLYDYLLIKPQQKQIQKFYSETVNTLAKTLPLYDLGYWSKYDLEMRIASPFYHNLHISQLTVLYNLTNITEFKIYSQKFNKYQKNFLYKSIAFVKKVIQKIKE